MQIRGISEEVLEVFRDYDWPGNVREFKNVIESAFNFVMSHTIHIEDLPEYIRFKAGDPAQSGIADEIGLKETVEPMKTTNSWI